MQRGPLICFRHRTHTVDGKESYDGFVGVGLNFGQGKNRLTLNASVNKGNDAESSNMLTHTETTLNAGNNVNIISERDSGNYDSKQQNASTVGTDIGHAWLTFSHSGDFLQDGCHQLVSFFHTRHD
jgi:hypothetical protein